MKILNRIYTKKYIVITKILFFIGLVFLLNFFLDALNSQDWLLFCVGLIGCVLTVIVMITVIFYKKEKKNEKSVD